MGALCVQKQSWSDQRLRVTRDATSSSYYYKISAYVYHYYGKPITSQIQQWVQKSYNPEYESCVYLLTGQTISTKKSQILDRLKTAHEKGFKSGTFNVVSVDKMTRTIKYNWIIQTKQNGKTVPVHYEISSSFDDQDRYLKSIWKQYEPQKPRPIIPYEAPKTSKPLGFQSSSNQFYSPPPQIDYAAQVQRSNKQFRNNMNKQAQQWNDYARQRNNRGY